MKKSIFPLLLVLPFAFALSLSSCSKDDDKDDPTPVAKNNTGGNSNSACTGGNGFCMDYGGTEKSGSARLIVLNSSNKIRVYWENGTGAAFEQVELDIYSLSPGTFPFNGLATPNTAFLQYFSTASGVNNVAYGNVVVSALDTTGGVTGTFTATMNDSTKITDGKFTNIVK